MSNYVLVLDTNKKPLSPCTPGMARSLLKAGKAAVYRKYQFTIILKKEVDAQPKSCQLKIDPGSQTTGLAILQDNLVIWAAELTHRGQQIKNDLESRRCLNGFPRTNQQGNLVRKSALVKQVKGFQTGDIVKAIVTKGQKIGSYLGQVAIRKTGSFNIKTLEGTVQGINWKYCSFVQRKDGYSYGFTDHA